MCSLLSTVLKGYNLCSPCHYEPCWPPLLQFRVSNSWFSVSALEALIGSISHLLPTQSGFSTWWLQLLSLKLHLHRPKAEISTPSCAVGITLPPEIVLILSPGFINFKVSNRSIAFPNFNVCSLISETHTSTRSRALTFLSPLNLVSLWA